MPTVGFSVGEATFSPQASASSPEDQTPRAHLKVFLWPQVRRQRWQRLEPRGAHSEGARAPAEPPTHGQVPSVPCEGPSQLPFSSVREMCLLN